LGKIPRAVPPALTMTMQFENIETEFEFLERLGSGTYGEVWKAQHKKTGKLLAIKKVKVDKDVSLLVREVSLMKKCSSPNIVKYYGNYFKGDVMWIIMEYCAIGSVSDAMNITNRTLTEEQIATVCRDILNGLDYLETNKKVHRDIKPHNILLNTKGEAKIGDFGVAQEISETGTQRKTVIGTPFYLAPEVIQETGYGPKADIWALGISAIEMAERNPPYYDLHPMRVLFLIANNPPPALTNPEHWSDDFNDFVRQCLQKDPNRRPNAKALLNHPFLKKANSASLLPFIQLTERLIKEHGGFEACMKYIEAMKRYKNDDEVSVGLSDLNEGLQGLPDDEDHSSGGSGTFGAFLDLLPISSAKFNEEGGEGGVELPVSPRLEAPLRTARSRNTENSGISSLGGGIPSRAAGVQLEDDDLTSTVDKLLSDVELFGPTAASTANNTPNALSSNMAFASSSAVTNSTATAPPTTNNTNIQTAPMSSLRSRPSARTETRSRHRPLRGMRGTEEIIEEAEHIERRNSIDWRALMEFEKDSGNHNNPPLTTTTANTLAPVWESSPSQLSSVSTPTHKGSTSMKRASSPNVTPLGSNPLFQFDDLLAELDTLGKNKRTSISALHPSDERERNSNQKISTTPHKRHSVDVESLRVSAPLSKSGSLSFMQHNPNYKAHIYHGAWIGLTAGKNPFRNNPQYVVSIARPEHVCVSLKTTYPRPIGFFVIQLRDIQSKLLTLPNYGLHTEVPFSTTDEASATILLQDSAMKYVIVACIDVLEPEERVEFELAILTAGPSSSFTVKMLPDFEQCVVAGEWKQHTAGGGINTSTWRLNPQYLLTVKKQPTDVHLFLTQTSSKLTHIALYCIRTDSAPQRKILFFEQEQLLTKDRRFFKRSEVTTGKLTLEPGYYVLIPCTYTSGHCGTFVVTVLSTARREREGISFSLTPIADWEYTTVTGMWREGRTGGCMNHSGWSGNPKYHFTISLPTEVTFILQREEQHATPRKENERPFIGFYIFRAKADEYARLSRDNLVLKTKHFLDLKEVSLSNISLTEGHYIWMPCTYYPGYTGPFCLHVFSTRLLSLELVNELSVSIKGEWKNPFHAGGCINFGTWRSNAQYCLELVEDKDTKVDVILEQDYDISKGASRLPHIGLLLVKAKAPPREKVMTITSKDLVATTEYLNASRVSLSVTLKASDAKYYIIIPTTFYSGEENKFTLTVAGTQSQALLAKIPDTMLHRLVVGEWSKANNTAGGCMNNQSTWTQNPKFVLSVNQPTKVLIILSQVIPTSETKPKELLAIGFYVFRKDGNEVVGSALTRRNLIAKSEFSQTKEVLLELMLEPQVYVILPTLFHSGKEGKFTLIVYATHDFVLTAV